MPKFALSFIGLCVCVPKFADLGSSGEEFPIQCFVFEPRRKFIGHGLPFRYSILVTHGYILPMIAGARGSLVGHSMTH